MSEEMTDLGNHVTEKCVRELTEAFMPIFMKYHGGHIMKAMAHLVAANIASQENVVESFDNYIAMVKKQTANCVDFYCVNDRSK